MNSVKIAVIASIGLLAGACDTGEDPGFAKTSDVKPTYDSHTEPATNPSTPPMQPRSTDNVNPAADMSELDSGMNSDLASDTWYDGMEIDEFEGKALVDLRDEKLGDVDRVVLDRVTGERMLVIGLQGIVGDGAKEVLVPLSEVTVSPNGEKLITNLSKKALEARPDIDIGDFTELGDVDY